MKGAEGATNLMCTYKINPNPPNPRLHIFPDTNLPTRHRLIVLACGD